MSILVSVVIPTYRRPGLLRKCLESLMRQTLDKKSFEIIVVSDGPDEATAKAIHHFTSLNQDLQLRYKTLSRNMGPAAARNAGWHNANGTLIAFTDDDCLADSLWLEKLWRGFDSNHDVCAFTGRIVVPIDENPTDSQMTISQLETAEFATANCACSRLALQITGGFDEQIRMAWREDSDLHSKLIEFCIPIIPIQDAVIIHPVRESPWGVSVKEQKKNIFNALLYKKYPRLYNKKIQRTAPWQYYLIVGSLIGGITGLLTDSSSVTGISIAIWAVTTLFFIVKRLAGTRKSAGHVAEMVLTSLVIPLLSVYWRCYGFIKYKTLFINR